MSNLVALVLIAVMPGPVVPAGTADSAAARPVVQRARLAEQPGSTAIGSQQARLDLTIETGGSAAPARGRPRVSQTRCAFVGCASQCDIKGTRDDGGAPVYRTPRSPLYDETKAEKMFCNLADAEAAGYRRSG